MAVNSSCPPYPPSLPFRTSEQQHEPSPRQCLVPSLRRVPGWLLLGPCGRGWPHCFCRLHCCYFRRRYDRGARRHKCTVIGPLYGSARRKAVCGRAALTPPPLLFLSRALPGCCRPHASRKDTGPRPGARPAFFPYFGIQAPLRWVADPATLPHPLLQPPGQQPRGRKSSGCGQFDQEGAATALYTTVLRLIISADYVLTMSLDNL